MAMKHVTNEPFHYAPLLFWNGGYDFTKWQLDFLIRGFGSQREQLKTHRENQVLMPKDFGNLVIIDLAEIQEPAASLNERLLKK